MALQDIVFAEGDEEILEIPVGALGTVIDILYDINTVGEFTYVCPDPSVGPVDVSIGPTILYGSTLYGSNIY